ncbi:TetR/AcrR family transcriptional regulator [Aureimonas mangrovi]|uniref:TetR/AcrR family transcriptional regulator n=1 Tax=Aureimonas mangrovi TaxID=2758041 RepID=UPI00163DB84A|nr:TetR/AcrR family transcriptional regulator [Aureimonas mangrovi]
MQNKLPTADAQEARPRARGRPRAFDRDAALDRATLLFWKKGFEATSIVDLTHAMGIGAPSLYAAFGSKEELYAEALRHYAESNQSYVWAGFDAALTAREAVRSFLMESAMALTGCVADIPRGCMVVLSSVGSEDHARLNELSRSTRAVTFERLRKRLARAKSEGEIPTGTNVEGLARFVQTVQSGMSILARDGASGADLESVADVAMAGYDARTTG